MLHVAVEDTGSGIRNEDIDKLFDSFQRVDTLSTHKIEGTGLGLAITRNAVLMHRGSIKVSSTEGEGSTFTVKIPLNYVMT